MEIRLVFLLLLGGANLTNFLLHITLLSLVKIYKKFINVYESLATFICLNNNKLIIYIWENSRIQYTQTFFTSYINVIHKLK